MQTRFKLPAFLEITGEDGPGWMALQTVASDPALRERAASQALAEVEEWLDRYRDLPAYFDHLGEAGPAVIAAGGIVNFLRQVRQQLGTNWPTSPDPDDMTESEDDEAEGSD
jgi:hypothetical protein